MTDFTAADGLVVTMLGVMFLSFGVVAMLLLSIRRNLARPETGVEELLAEVSAMEASLTHSGVGNSLQPERQAWERDADWWKN